MPIAGKADADSGAARSQMLPALRPVQILLAEDDDEMRHLLAAALRRDGHEVIQASDGTEAVGYLLALLRGSTAAVPDLIITDIRMPGWTGIRILEIVRAGPVPMPVILITAFGADEAHATARHLGAAAVFDKPFDVDDLRAAVLKLVPQR